MPLSNQVVKFPTTPQEMAVFLCAKKPSILEFWTVQNTGWSAGSSWFSSGGTHYEPSRFNSEAQARSYIERNRWNDESVKWRFTHVVVDRSEHKRVTTEEWVEVVVENISRP